MIFDSHAHYDDEKFDDDRDELLLSLHQNGIDYITNVGCNLKTSFASLELAKKYSFIYATAGFHPEDILDLDDDAMLKIESLLKEEKVVAMGEIGLDYHYDSPTPEKQKEAFIKQLSLAKELDVPVIIHSRDAASDTFEIIKKFKPKGVVHCFSGSREMAEEYVNMGMYVGLTGVVTFSNARKALEVAAAVPTDRLLIETDCPYLAPVPMRGKRCDSSMLKFTADAIAKVRNETVEAVMKNTLDNAKRLYNIK